MTNRASRRSRTAPRSRLRIAAGRILLLILIPIVLFKLWTLESDLLFHPRTGDPLAEMTDAAIRSRIREVSFSASDGTSLGGWYVAGQPERPTVVFAHGETGHMAPRAHVLKAFLIRGYGIFMFDYRGYGKSGGSPSEAGFYDDFASASRYVAETYNIPPARQIAAGESLGGVVALEAARTRPYAAVLIFSTPTSAPDMLAAAFEARGLGFFNAIPYHGLMRQRFEALPKIAEVTSPVVIVHGRLDQDIPPEMSRTLFNGAKIMALSYLLVEEGGHGDLLLSHADEIFNRLDSLLRQSGP